MTTIACNKDVMCADSKVTMEGREDRTYEAAKLLVTKNGDILGAAGSNDNCEIFFKWYGTKKKKPKIQGDFEALVLSKDGQLFFYDETFSCDKLNNDFYAVGSGGNAARAAMFMGADPVRAVEIACLVDPHSGPPVQIIRREV